MKFLIPAIGCLFFFSSCNSINRLYSLYGDTKVTHEASPVEPNVTRIYFDRLGFVLPDYHVPDQMFRKADAQFKTFYCEHDSIRQRISTQYNVEQKPGCNAYTSTDNIQQAVIDQQIKKLNSNASKYDKLIFLIHGFNKHAALPDDPDREFRGNSTTEFEGMRTYITQHFPKTRFHFVEVYWDACSARNGNSLFTPFNIKKFWDNSQAHANNVGLELRRILSGLQNTNLYLISHSLGASVATTSLINARQFSSAAYINPDSYVSYILERQNDSKYNAPTRNIRIGMIAPAIPGANVFDEYYQRTVAGKDTETSLSNFSFVVGFNEHDIVLNKLIGLSTKFGASSLGCRGADLSAAKTEVNNDPNILTEVDFSNKTLGAFSKQKSHSIKDYLTNEHFKPFLEKLFEN